MSKIAAPRVHPKWYRQPQPEPTATTGIPPMECEACHDYYVPKRAGQKYCTRPECVTRRDRQRQQERRKLQQMMESAERKKQQKHDGIGKAQMAEVKRVFRETRGRAV